MSLYKTAFINSKHYDMCENDTIVDAFSADMENHEYFIYKILTKKYEAIFLKANFHRPQRTKKKTLTMKF